MKEDVFTLPEVDAILQWPEVISQETYQDLKSWTDLMMRKIQRSIGKKDEVAEE